MTQISQQILFEWKKLIHEVSCTSWGQNPFGILTPRAREPWHVGLQIQIHTMRAKYMDHQIWMFTGLVDAFVVIFDFSCFTCFENIHTFNRLAYILLSAVSCNQAVHILYADLLEVKCLASFWHLPCCQSSVVHANILPSCTQHLPLTSESNHVLYR